MSDAKNMLYNVQSRSKLIKGITKLSNAVGSTLGPNGKNVLIQRRYQGPKVTKDGVSVAREVFLKDPAEDMGAQLVKEASLNTNDMVGDGTTTSTILAHQLAKNGYELIEKDSKINPVVLNKGISLAKDKFIEYLEEMAEPVNEDWSKIAQIASISSNNDLEIGELIANSFEKVGKDGVVTIEQSGNIETYSEIVAGIEYRKGYLSPKFVTDKDRMRTEYEDCYVLLVNDKIRSAQSLIPILDKVSRNDNRPIIIICDDIDPQPLKMIISANMQGTLNAVVTKSPAFGEERTEFMEDIATVTGTFVLSENSPQELTSLQTTDLGICEKVVVDANKTTISGGAGDIDEIEERADQIKSMIDDTDYPTKKENLKRRMSRLLGGVCVLYVGANTESEMGERKDRIEDALQATKAALEEGVLPGGGVVFLRFPDSDLYKDLLAEYDEDSDIYRGITLFGNSMVIPIYRILMNAGLSVEEFTDIASKLADTDKYNEVYNARTMEFENYKETGVLDPKKVLRVAIESAVSSATMVLTTDCIMFYEETEEEDDGPTLPFLG